MSTSGSFKVASANVVKGWSWLKAIFRPALLLWPWLVSTATFWIFLQSSQGEAITGQMAGSAWYSWMAVVAITVSFVATLFACMLTALVILSWRRTDGRPSSVASGVESVIAPPDGRGLGILYVSWAFALSAAPMLLLAWATKSMIGLGVTLLVGLCTCITLQLVVFRGTWKSATDWSIRLEQLRRRRFYLALGVVATAAAPLLVGALWLVRTPESATTLGPAFVAMLGLSALSSLFAALFIALPYCTLSPRLAALVPLAMVAVNVLYQPLADTDNPLLREEAGLARAKFDSEAKPPINCSRTSRRLAKALQDQATRVIKEAKSPDGAPALYFVSAEGGGIRAAYWTAMGLVNLEESIPDFQDRIATMSGVSGGSLGIATWLAAVEATDDVAARRSLVHDFLGSDLLSPAIAGLLFLDTPRLIFGPLWLTARRDDVFEAVIARRWRQVAGMDADFFVRPLVNLCFRKMKNPPTVYFGTTEVLLGAFAPMGNTNFGMPGGGRQFLNGLLRQSALVEANVVHSVVMSARFPFLAPTADVAVSLENVHDYLTTGAPLPRSIRTKMNGGIVPEGFPTIPGSARLGMLVDGGYFDNSGLSMTRYALDVLATNVQPPPKPLPERGIVPQKEWDQEAKSSHTARAIVATHVIHFSNDPSSACVEPRNWEINSSRAVREAIQAAKFKPVCQFQIEELETLFRPRWFSWISSPIEAILAVRSGHATHEVNAMRMQLLTRQYPSVLFDYSLAEELTQQLCEGRGSAQSREKCLSAGGRSDMTWRSAFNGQPAAGNAIQERAQNCQGLTQSTPLPLGWSLHPGDTALMQCLAANAALNALAHMTKAEGDYRLVASSNAQEVASSASQEASGQRVPK